MFFGLYINTNVYYVKHYFPRINLSTVWRKRFKISMAQYVFLVWMNKKLCVYLPRRIFKSHVIASYSSHVHRLCVEEFSFSTNIQVIAFTLLRIQCLKILTPIPWWIVNMNIILSTFHSLEMQYILNEFLFTSFHNHYYTLRWLSCWWKLWSYLPVDIHFLGFILRSNLRRLLRF